MVTRVPGGKGLDKIAERFLQRAATAQGWELSQRHLHTDGAEAIQYSALTVEGSGEPIGRPRRLDESGRRHSVRWKSAKGPSQRPGIADVRQPEQRIRRFGNPEISGRRKGLGPECLIRTSKSGS